MLFIYLYRASGEERAVLPTGIGSLMAVLRQAGIPCRLEVMLEDAGTAERFLALMEEHQPKLLGFSVLNSNRAGCARLSALCKERYPAVRVIWGGPTVTCLAPVLEQVHGAVVDHFVVGEAEHALRRLVTDLTAGVPRERLVYPRPDELVDDLDALPSVLDESDCGEAAIGAQAQYSILTSRGCFGKCTFCASPFFRKQVRYRSPRSVVDELLCYQEHCPPDRRTFHIVDDLFTARKPRTLEICQSMHDEGVRMSWVASARVDTIDEELLEAMSAAGCASISFGIESGSERVRNEVYHKRIPTERIIAVFDLTKAYGIIPGATFIVGAPGESEATIGETQDLVRTIHPLDCTFIPLQVFPGTPLGEDYQRRTGQSDLELWGDPQRVSVASWELDPSLSPSAIEAFQQTLFTDYYRGFVDYLPELVARLKAEPRPGLVGKYSQMLWSLFVQVGYNTAALEQYCPGFDAGMRTRLPLLEGALFFDPTNKPLQMVVAMMKAVGQT